MIKAGRDPRAKAAKLLTFKEAAEQLIEMKRPGWRNAKHAAQWPRTLATYVYPSLGDRDTRSIGTADVLAVLSPLWNAKPETASRVRQRIEAVLDYATALEAREGANAARWRGHLANLLPRPGKIRAVQHHAALDWREAPVFWAALREREGSGARALAFAILTAARSGEVRGMRWREIDIGGAVWTVPAARIKAGQASIGCRSYQRQWPCSASPPSRRRSCSRALPSPARCSPTCHCRQSSSGWAMAM